MKNYKILTAAVIMAVSGAVYAETEVTDVMSSDKGDQLSSQVLYWEQVNARESSKNAALQLKIQNNGLSATANKTEKTTRNDVGSLREFLELSMSDKELLSGDSGSQEDLLSEFGVVPQNIETIGTVDNRGNAIASNDNSSVQLGEMKKQQEVFFEEMVNFVNSSLKDITQKVKTTEDADLIEAEVAKEAVVATPAAGAGGDFSYEMKKISPFLPPSAKINRITAKGVEVVMVFEFKDLDEKPSFVNTVIDENTKGFTVHPAVSYSMSYDVKSFEKERIVVESSYGETIIITK